jgi:uncharacterized protein
VNYSKHGVSFDRARLVFSAPPLASPNTTTREDHGENRFTRVGIVEGSLLFVSYTERCERIRIISARRATRHEQDDYYQQNGQTH